jgi:invasion protein IalB
MTLLGSSIAAAAPASVASPAIPAWPTETSATYGNWNLRCVRSASNKSERICEVFQQVQSVRDNQRAVLLNVAVGSLAPSKPLLVTVGLPPNFMFAGGVRIGVDPNASTELKFERCVDGLCFASAALTDALLTQLKATGDSGRVDYQGPSGQPVSVPVSRQGFSQALSALIEELGR